MTDEDSESISTQSNFKLPPNVTQEVNILKLCNYSFIFSYLLNI